MKSTKCCNDDDDDDDFNYTHRSSATRGVTSTTRLPREHDETELSSRKLLQPKFHQNILHKLQNSLGQVVYGDCEMISIIATYWEDIMPQRIKKDYLRHVKCDMLVESEGVIINRAICLDRCLCYHYPHYYKRLTSSCGQATFESNESIKAIGSGQFGRVFQAVDVQSCQFFAEKIISLDKFCRNELEIMSRVQHEHVIQFYGVVRTPVGIHIFMQYAAGGNIDQLLQGGDGFVGRQTCNKHWYAEYWAMVYYKQIISAVVYLHSLGIVHCDIKTNNVVLSSDHRNCFLTDFGEACKMPSDQTFIELESAKGTPNYMSPEVITSYNFYYSSDVWCAGGFLLHMLTGQLPWTVIYPASSTSVNAYYYVIGTKPSQLKNEIPNWVTSMTRSILSSSFQDVMKRKSSRELLALAKRNLSILNNAEMERSESPVSLYELTSSTEESNSASFISGDNEQLVVASSSHGVSNSPLTTCDVTNDQTVSTCLKSSNPFETAELAECIDRIQKHATGTSDDSNDTNGKETMEELRKLLVKYNIEDSNITPTCSDSVDSAVNEVDDEACADRCTPVCCGRTLRSTFRSDGPPLEVQDPSVICNGVDGNQEDQT